MKVTKSFTLSKETIDKLKEFSHNEYSTNSASVERILNKYIDGYNEEKEKKKRIQEEDKKFIKNNLPDPNHITPPHFDKVDVNAGEPINNEYYEK